MQRKVVESVNDNTRFKALLGISIRLNTMSATRIPRQTMGKRQAGAVFKVFMCDKLSYRSTFRLCKMCVRDLSITPQKKCNVNENRSQKTEVKWVKPEGYETGITIYNSLTNRKEPFILPRGQVASWYACGPTVYDHAHIGHASSYVRQDVIRRIMENLHKVDTVFILGVTDIDDKIIKRSNEQGVHFQDLTRKYENSFFEDMKRMNVLPPTLCKRVTDHVPQIIQFIQQICDNGYAYKTASGDVYFDLPKFGRYNRFVSHNMELAEEHAEVDQSTEKKHKNDFALWKAVKPDEPFWDSPWGRGRPGWHIECSAMASSVFGNAVDVHSGGEDLKFPHHQNEVSQSEAHFCCDQWTNYWLHTGHLHVRDDVKMSKSLNNTILISHLLKTYTANQFRLFCMMRPYRNTIEYSTEDMEIAARMMKKWDSFLSTADGYVKSNLDCGPINEPYILHSLQKTKENVFTALKDDFDTRRAINAIMTLIKTCNIEIAEKPNQVDCARSPTAMAAVLKYLEDMYCVLGFSRLKHQAIGHDGETLNRVVDATLKFRENVRIVAMGKDKDAELSKEERKNIAQSNQLLFKHCDELRTDLFLRGIDIKDKTKGGAAWEFHTERDTPED